MNIGRRASDAQIMVGADDQADKSEATPRAGGQVWVHHHPEAAAKCRKQRRVTGCGAFSAKPDRLDEERLLGVTFSLDHSKRQVINPAAVHHYAAPDDRTKA